MGGESAAILDWYRDTCGMVRFRVDSEEGEEGKVLDEEIGLRLKVGEWMSEWLCTEKGSQTNTQMGDRNFKLVLAEPLEEATDSHVNRFLFLNPGPGIQHIGLCTDNIQQSVATLTRRGVE